jgi:hypothetical protein
MADAGYQLITSVIFVIRKRDFDYSEGFRSDRLGCDVVVEFGLGEVLFVGGSRGEFLNFAGLIISDGCANAKGGRSDPGILASFVAYFDCTGDFAVDLLQACNGFVL